MEGSSKRELPDWLSIPEPPAIPPQLDLSANSESWKIREERLSSYLIYGRETRKLKPLRLGLGIDGSKYFTPGDLEPKIIPESDSNQAYIGENRLSYVGTWNTDGSLITYFNEEGRTFICKNTKNNRKALQDSNYQLIDNKSSLKPLRYLSSTSKIIDDSGTQSEFEKLMKQEEPSLLKRIVEKVSGFKRPKVEVPTDQLKENIRQILVSVGEQYDNLRNNRPDLNLKKLIPEINTPDFNILKERVIDRLRNIKVPLTGIPSLEAFRNNRSQMRALAIDTLKEAGIGFVVRSGTRIVLASIIPGGIPYSLAVGGVAGGITGGFREYRRENKEYKSTKQEWLNSQKGSEKSLELIAKWQAMDKNRKKRIGIAIARGAVAGAVGGVIGGALTDYLTHHLDLEAIKLPEINFGQNQDLSAGASGLDADKPYIDGGISHPDNLPYHPNMPIDSTIPPPLPDDTNPSLYNAYEPAEIKGKIPEEIVNNFKTTPSLEEATQAISAHDSFVKPDLTTGASQAAEDLSSQSGTLDLLQTDHMPEGSNPWSFSEDYLQNHGIPNPTNDQIAEATHRLMEASNITESANIPIGYELHLNSVNDYISQITHEGLTSLETLENISLPSGSNIWEESAKLIEKFGGQASNQQILDIAKEICKTNNIQVPEWGLTEGTLATNLPAGKTLVINDTVKSLLKSIINK